jgi:hypothetical protein
VIEEDDVEEDAGGEAVAAVVDAKLTASFGGESPTPRAGMATRSLSACSYCTGVLT